MKAMAKAIVGVAYIAAVVATLMLTKSVLLTILIAFICGGATVDIARE